MAFNRPSMTELVERVSTDIETRLPGADARLRRSNLSVLARVVAAVSHGLYGFLTWQSKQIIADTSDGDILERQASLYGIARKSATFATGNVTFVGLNDVAIPVGTLLQRSDGLEYRTTAKVIIAAGTATAPVIAQVAGEEANTIINTKLAIAAQIFGINANATVATGGLVSGTGSESDDALRDRYLFRLRKPPQGGAEHDYQAWSLEVPGVTRAWVKPLYLGLGTVGLFFVRDGDASMIPDAGEVATVQAYIDERRPVTSDVTVIAPVALPVAMSITLIPNTAEVRAAVTAELLDVFRRESEPGGTILISHLREAVSLAAGESDHAVTVPAGNVVATAGQMPTLGVITWA